MLDVLQGAGLTPTEAKVYLALLETGEAKTGTILVAAKINSGRIYNVLEALKQKGLVSTVVRERVRHFVPAPPERLIDYLEKKKRDVSAQQESISGYLSLLEKKYASIKEHTKVETYFGIEGQRTAYELLFREAEKDKTLLVTGVVSKEKYPAPVLNLLQQYVYKTRVRLGLKTYKLVAEEARGDTFYAQDKAIIRYLPYPTLSSLQVLGGVTLLTFEREPILTILIHDKSIAEDHRRQFQYLWKHARR